VRLDRGHGRIGDTPRGEHLIGEVQRGALGLREDGSVEIATPERVDPRPAQWTKLIVNLNNALGAVSGLDSAGVLADAVLPRLSIGLMREGCGSPSAPAATSTPGSSARYCGADRSGQPAFGSTAEAVKGGAQEGQRPRHFRL